MNKKFEKYINKITADKVENYGDTSCPDDDIVRGSRDKKFVRFSGDVFGDLICELRDNPNCSYDTYMNDVIKSGYNPQYLSVLKKEVRDDDFFREKDKYGLGHLADVCASRILNYFECPTTYETILNIDGQLCECSVDFNNVDEDFYDMQGLNGVYSFYDQNDLQKHLDCVDRSLNAFKNNQLKRKFDSTKDLKRFTAKFDRMASQFKEDYIYSWLIRIIVLCDSDYNFYNLGLIYNTKDDTFRMAPNFDLEYAFENFYGRSWSCSNIDNFQFVALKYPKVYKKFVDKLKKLITKENGKSRVRNILESVTGKDEAKSFISDYTQHLKELCNLISEVAPVNEKL